ncbi:MAG: AMP-binding protein [Acidobacteriota bacterium]
MTLYKIVIIADTHDKTGADCEFASPDPLSCSVMPPARATLLSFLDDFRRLGRREFLLYSDGYRTHRYSYAEFCDAVDSFAARLVEAGIQSGDKVLFWSENRPEWLVAFWGCLRQGVAAVPLDYRTDAQLLSRVQQIVQGRLLLVGNEVEPVELGIPIWPLANISWQPASPPPAAIVTAETVVEIVFTSGTTGEPKGVVIQHRNILANLATLEPEIRKYRRSLALLTPLRLLNLLPLSHLFGQSLATFIPPLLPGATVFLNGYSPNRILETIRRHRISVLVSVPKIVDLLAAHVERVEPAAGRPPQGEKRRTIPGRLWRFRRVHRLFGWKFWALVVGAAPLDRRSEEFWGRLGFVVVQGYGLTETAPIVSVNHPLRPRSGSLGKPLGGLEVRLGDDGEILVRGEAVFSGYYQSPADTQRVLEDGWLHTGDVGAFDQEGRLYFRGRKKDVIVTAEGLNVFPEDVEQVVEQLPGVGECAVIGLAEGVSEHVHAVIVLKDTAIDPQRIQHDANLRLQDFQKIRSISVWPEEHLPRTDGTGKLKRRDVRARLRGEPAAAGTPPHAGESNLEDWIARLARRSPGEVGEELRLEEDLGLNSLERVELLSTLEQKLGVSVDEEKFAQAARVGDLKRLAEHSAQPAAAIRFPRWSRSLAARMFRRAATSLLVVPLMRRRTHLKVGGLEHLAPLQGPVLFAASHASHLDTPAIIAALPPPWRDRVAPAMSLEYFLMGPQLKMRLLYSLACLFFNAFPIPQKEAGVRQTLQYMGDLVDAGFSPVVFPEGERLLSEEVGRFQPGIALMASRLGIPVVPVRLRGTGSILPPNARWFRPGKIRIQFGAPLHLKGADYASLARTVEQAVRNL